jgi:hypothetical protein
VSKDVSKRNSGLFEAKGIKGLLALPNGCNEGIGSVFVLYSMSISLYGFEEQCLEN